MKISEYFLGSVPEDYQFQPKHKSNAYASEVTVSAPNAASNNNNAGVAAAESSSSAIAAAEENEDIEASNG